MLSNESIRQLVSDLLERMKTDMPETGDFQTIYVELEPTAPDRAFSCFMLRVDPLPAGMQDSDSERCLSAVAYHPSLPYQSKRTLQYATKQTILELLAGDTIVPQIQNLIPKLEDDLRGL